MDLIVKNSGQRLRWISVKSSEKALEKVSFKTYNINNLLYFGFGVWI